jgi:hypothetical protein
MKKNLSQEMRSVTIRVPPELHRDIKMAAVASGRKVRDMYATMLQGYLDIVRKADACGSDRPAN